MSCLLPNAVKPVADKYGASIISMETAIYLYQAKYGEEKGFNENDETFIGFMNDYFKRSTLANYTNDKDFNRAYEIWEKYEGEYKLENPENRASMLKAFRDVLGDDNVVVFTDTNDDVVIKFSEPTLNGYTKEMLDIKEKTLKDGTFMKAPNGKPTNLTEKQWLQVKTKAFKDWFGDWENDPTNASKVVDENGEPLVVYSGRPYKGTTNFSKTLKSSRNRANLTGLLKKGIYFAKDKSVAKMYESSFDIKNPLDKELKRYGAGEDGAFFTDKELFLSLHKDVTEDHYNLLLNRYYEVLNDPNNPTGEFYAERTEVEGEIIEAFLNIKNPIVLDNKRQSIAHLTEENINSINNSEGAIIKNVDENIGVYEIDMVTDDYIAFEPNQIKSATDNNGRFSKKYDNIYASESDTVGELLLEGESSDKSLNEKFGNKDTTTAIEILNKLKEFNSPFTPLINTLLENLDELLPNLNLRLVDSESMQEAFNKPRTVAAVYDRDSNWIYIAKDVAFKGKNGTVDATVLHEIFHAIVRNSTKTAEHKEALQKIFDTAKESILKKYGVNSVKELRAKSKYFNETFYGLESLDEFISEFFTNGAFVVELNKIGPKAKGDSVVGKMLNFIKSLFKKFFKKESQLYSEASALIEDIMLNANQVYNGDMLDGDTAVANEGWGRTSKNGYEVSSVGDSRFSALNAKFKNGTIIFGHDVSNRTIESVYQHGVKQNDWVTNNNSKTGTPKSNEIIHGNTPDDSYRDGYLPLWQEWAKQNPELIEDLRKKSKGKTLTDRFVSNKTTVSQARALSDILSNKDVPFEEKPELERLAIVKNELLKVIKYCKSHYGFNEKDHFYFLKDANGKQTGEKITNTASSFKVEGSKLVKTSLDSDEDFVEYWKIPSTTLGSNTDEIFRDGFTENEETGEMGVYATEYDNIDEETLESLKSDIELVRSHWEKQGIYLLNADFPMVARRTYEEDGKMKTELIGGSMDLIGYDADGNVYTFDLKNKHSEKEQINLQEDYDGQQNIYRGMFTAVIKSSGAQHLHYKSKDQTDSGLRIIQLTTDYPHGKEYKYEKIDGELYLAKRKKWGSRELGKKYAIDENLDKNERKEFIKENWIKYSDWAAEHPNNTTKLVILDEETPKEFRLNLFDDFVKQIEALDEETLGESPKKAVQRAKNEMRKAGRATHKMSTEDLQRRVLLSSNIKSSDLTLIANSVMDEVSTRYDCLQGLLGEDAQKEAYCEILNNKSENPIDIAQLDDAESDEYKEFERITKLDRDSLMKEIPIRKVLDTVKETLLYKDEETGEIISEDDALDEEEAYVIRALKLCYDNFDGLINMGYQRFILLENKVLVRTSVDPEDIKQDGEQDTNVDIDNVSNKDLEHWMVEHMSNKASLSGEWRRIIAKMAVVKNGRKESNKFGFFNRMDSNMVINNLLTWFKDCTTLDEMITILERRCQYYPEYKQILKLIKYSDNEPKTEEKESLRSKFFQNFRKDFQTYSIVIVDIDPKTGEPTYTNMVINTSTASEAVLSELGRKFHLGFEFTEKLFKDKNINSKYTGELRTRLIRLQKDYKDSIQLLTRNRGRVSTEKISEDLLEGEFFNKFKSLLDEFGLNLNEQTLKMLIADVLSAKSTRSGDSFRDNDSINEIFYQLTLALNVLRDYKPTDHTYSIFKEKPDKNEYSIRDYYKNILNILGDYMEEYIESSTYENGKMHYSFNPPSYTGKLFINMKKALTNQEEFDKFVKDEYGKYRWFATDAEEGKLPKYWLNPLMQMMYDSDKDGLTNFAQYTRKILEHRTQLSYRKTPYVELGGLSYLSSVVCEFFEDTADVTSENLEYTKANYRMPIQANKPSSEYITMPRFIGKGYKDRMCKYFFNVFVQELMRIRTVLERAAEGDYESIASYDINITEDTEKIIKNFKDNKFKFSDLKVLSDSGACFKFLSMFNDITLSEHFDKNVRSSENNVVKYIENFINYKTSLLDKDGNVSGKIMPSFVTTFKAKMDNVFAEEYNYFENIGLLEAVTLPKKKDTDEDKGYLKYFTRFEQIKGATIQEQKAFVKTQLENFVWNDMLASINTIELTATDLAYYKNTEDFQKRFAQVHAPGLRLNIEAYGAVGKMVDGHREMIRVSDDWSRTMYLADDERPTGINKTVNSAFNVLIDRAKKIEDKTQKQTKITALETMQKVVFTALNKVNIADAQALTSPTGMMKKLTMAGAWTHDMTEAYYRICSGNFNLSDLQVLMQPLKPFVYSQIKKNGSETMPLIKVGLQNKNSEYMILLADAIIRSAGKNNKLTALFDFMEATAYDGRTIYRNGKVYKDNVELTGKDLTEYLKSKNLNIKDLKDGQVLEEGEYNAHGIDTIQFESAVKVGLQGAIDINDQYDEDGKKIAEASYDAIIRMLKSRTKSSVGLYNENYVHTFYYKDYAVQQEVPAHLRDHRQLMGSQLRILGVTDIPFNTKISFITKEGKTITEFGDLVDIYQKDIAANIIDSFNKLIEEMGLDSEDEGEIAEKLSELLKQEIGKDARYGTDLQTACMLNEQGKFVIPLNDPIQSTRIQQLLHSIIKSRINKQKVPGGPVVQASCYGLEQKYNIRFEGENGEILKTFNEYNGTREQYDAYLKKNMAKLKYFECAMPVPSEELERKLIKLAKWIDKRNGVKYTGRLATPDEAVEYGLITEEQLKGIGYRIPTEDKYSMYPMRVVEWVPKAAGEVIILPAEITILTGSDFDIDKTYIMLKSFSKSDEVNALYDKLKNDSKFKEYDEKELKSLIENWSTGKLNNQELEEKIDDIAFFVKKDGTKRSLIHYKEDNYNERNIRNNEIFDIQWFTLTSPEAMDKMFNPGSFDPQKKTARIIQILKANNGINKEYTRKKLQKKSLKELNSILKSLTKGFDNNIVRISTQIKFQQQNMTAGKLIGIFANNNVSHGFIQMQDVQMNFSKDENIYFDGVSLEGAIKLDDIYARNKIDYVSKNIAGFLAASVDAVKDPVLNYMNLNTFTSGVAMTLARLGFDVESIGLFLSQPILIRAANLYANKNNDGYISAADTCIELLNELSEDLSDELKSKGGWRAIPDNEMFTKDDLADNINGGDPEYEIKVLKLFNKLLTKANALNDLTFLTKFNSMSNAAGPTIADTIIMTRRKDRFEDSFKGDSPIFNENAKHIIDNSPILNAFYSTTIGENGAAARIFERWFIHYTPAFRNIIKYWEETTKSPLDEKTLNKLVNEWILFKLTKPVEGEDTPFFDTSEDNRNYFINEFPEDFLTLCKKYNDELKDNKLISIIKENTGSKKCKVATLEANTGGFAADTQEEIKNAWTELINSDNEEISQLGRDLFFYCLYRNGFGFSPKTFIHLASVDTKLAMGYVDILNDDNLGGIEFNDDVDYMEFIRQFKRNHSDDTKIVPKFGKNDFKNEKVKIDQNVNILTIIPKDGPETVKQKFNKLLGSTKQKPIQMFKYNNKLYALDVNRSKYENTNDWELYYYEVQPLGINNNFLEYDANVEKGTIETVIGKSKKKNNNVDNSRVTEEDGDGPDLTNEGTAYDTAPDDIPFDPDYYLDNADYFAFASGIDDDETNEKQVVKQAAKKTKFNTSFLTKSISQVNKKNKTC